jgi:hypothetical protein
VLSAICLVGEVAAQDRAAKLLAEADRVTAEVVKLRGLARLKTIKRGVLDKPAIEVRIRERIRTEYKPEEIAAEALALKRFGLLPPAVDYLELVTRLLTSQVAGFYDPFTEELYIARWASAGGDMLLAHEIDHALTDQHFDLEKLLKGERDNSDATAARQALVEGDGTALMMEYLFSKMGKSAPWGEPGVAAQIEAMMNTQASQIKGAPPALRAAMIFPYAAGVRFVAHFRRHQPWSAIDVMYRKPPLSTEHILHPETYEAYEKPVFIKASVPAVMVGYKLAYNNVSGEKALSVMLEVHGVDAATAAVAAAGWGGDRTVVLTPPGFSGQLGAAVAVVASAWDAEADAIEFFEALSHALPSIAGKGSAPVVGNEPKRLIRYRDKAGAVVTAHRAADQVVLIVGAPPAREPDIRAAALKWPRK